MHLLSLPAALSVLAFVSALPSTTSNNYLPLLIWHGLGDRYDADGLHTVGDLAKKIHPGTHVHYIRIDDDGDQDRSATFFGNVTEQVSQVCEDLKANKELLKYSFAATGKSDELVVDAVGFSQGGQFLRGLLQRCDGLAIRSLVTFGSQHNGIAEIKACGQWDLLCKGALALMKSNAWTDYVQSRVVPAQYYRTLNESTGLASEEYLEHSNFLADINNERDVKNQTYKEKLVKSLGKFVMFIFVDDATVIPRESGWFSEVVNGTSEEDRVVIPLKERTMYKEDWLGLKKLDEQGKLVFKTHPGEHMQLDEDVLKEAFEEYFGSERREGQDTKVKFDCLEYKPSWLSEVFSEIKAAWERRGHFMAAWTGSWKSRMYKQGL